LLALAGVLAVCGCGTKVTSDSPRAVVQRYGQASAARDYQEICDHLIAPILIRTVERVGLPCEIAFQRGLSGVQRPHLEVGAVKLFGNAAYVNVRSSALNQTPSDDWIHLVKTASGWRIEALSSTPPPLAPAAPGPKTTPRPVPPPGAFPSR